MTSKVNIVLRNPLSKYDQLSYCIESFDHKLGDDWIKALKKILLSGKILEKNFCFVGFPNTARDTKYLCGELNRYIKQIKKGLPDYHLNLEVTQENIYGFDYDNMGINHNLFNQLHNHFEILQGTVGNLSEWYIKANYDTKFAIRQLNNICHELESLILSQRKAVKSPYWIRPSQITTWINADRYNLEPEHRQLFLSNRYDRKLGGVYMHWTQIGKTLFEVFRDENAPKFDATTCEAITHLKYYSGEFDIEWGNDIVRNTNCSWHDKEQEKFVSWLRSNNLDPNDSNLSLGYLPIGQVKLIESFGTNDYQTIWKQLSTHLDIYHIEVDGVSQTFDYCWTDYNWKQQQINMLKPGYDFNSRKEHAVVEKYLG